ncbi:unnamed protein product [Caenorhabditis auriculariae]|uniref:Purine nucleoside phosphorylase n=1 Tax=Caenorhabditis auriculariae TaxID=2777116 RepID=A0A8S1HIR7_9PELO|nr:unnamed protein product [Caenorhabditis auriculariae]
MVAEKGTEPLTLQELLELKIDASNFMDNVAVAKAIKLQIGEFKPEIGIICGSGLTPIGEQLEKAIIVPYSQIPGFPRAEVPGHTAALAFGELEGKKIMCMLGRFHPYEYNMDLTLCSMPVRIMHLLGVQTLIVSNAAGAINRNFEFGDLMLIKDQIFLPGLAGYSPIVKLKDPHFGNCFVSMHSAYDKSLRTLAKKVAKDIDLKLHEGIYVMSGGPQYESPAEVMLYKTVGADALGMSTCHEVTVARQCGIRVVGFSLITNIGNLDADNAAEVTHDEVLDVAKFAANHATKFVRQLVKELDDYTVPPLLDKKTKERMPMYVHEF